MQIDIDLIFSSLTGRLLILLNEKGIIIKANADAINVLGADSKENIIDKNWDDTFGKLAQNNFSFTDLLQSTTGYLSIELNTQNTQDLLEIKIDTLTITEKYAGQYYLIVGRRKRMSNYEDMLFQVMKGTEKAFGEDFILSITKALAETLHVEHAFIGKYIKGEEDKVNTLSFWSHGKYQDNIVYTVSGTPCENVLNHRQKLISRNAAKKFPKHRLLKTLKVESYFGTPIFYNNGEALGLLVVMDSKAMEENPASAYILNIFANRIGAEIERAEAEATLLYKDRKLKNVLDAIPHPIFYKDNQGRYEGINKAFMDTVNFEEADILGKKSINYKSEKSESSKFDNELLSSPKQVSYDSILNLSSGESRNYLMTKSSLLDNNGDIDGLVGSAMDITKLKAAEKKLKKSEEKYRTLFSQANDAIFIMNEAVFLDCNDKTLEIFGCTQDEIIGHSPAEFSPILQPNGKNSKEEAAVKIANALKHKSQNFYWKHIKKSGNEFDAEVSLNAFYIDEKLFIQVIVRDVTDKIALAKNLELQKARMEEMYKYISASDISFQDQLASLLALATKSLGMDVGLLSRIEDDNYSIIDLFGKSTKLNKKKSYKLEETYCSITFNKNRLLTINEMGVSEYKKHPCYEAMQMESYIGTPYWVRGERYGTLAFLSPHPIAKFRPIDLDFVQMLAQWIGSAMERSQFEEKLVERDALLDTMLRELPVDFSVRDKKSNIIIQSDLSKEYWGKNEKDPDNHSDIDEKTKIKWRNNFSRALKGEVVRGESNVKLYGEPYSFYSIYSPIKVKGKIAEAMTINVDVTKLKESENKLKEQNEQLTKLNTELDRFVYSASHDLRAPLASLLGLIDLSSREKNTDNTIEYLGLMSKSINTMNRFITEITEYSRNLRLDTMASSIDFNKLFLEAFDHLQYVMPSPVKHSISISGKTPFYTDHDRLKMVVNNLLSNSIRYKAYNRDVFIALNVVITNEKVQIDVADNGIGIGKKHLSHVFEMFYRANNQNIGSGLGLFIVKETIEKLDGTISITSQSNEGTQVHIELPNLAP